MSVYVQIIEKKTKKVIKQIKCHSTRLAISVEGGVNIDLNHEDYETNIASKPSEDCEADQ
jgi:hypothetical protein